MRRRIELRETVIAPGAIVRLKKEWSTCLKDKMARWGVLEMLDGGSVTSVADVEDRQDTRCFITDHLERVSGGGDAVVGYAWVEEDAPLAADSWADASYEDDPYVGDDTEIEYPSLFDDPIQLQLDEDADDPDAAVDCEHVE